jgi:hypothetical protein
MPHSCSCCYSSTATKAYSSCKCCPGSCSSTNGHARASIWRISHVSLISLIVIMTNAESRTLVLPLVNLAREQVVLVINRQGRTNRQRRTQPGAMHHSRRLQKPGEVHHSLQPAMVRRSYDIHNHTIYNEHDPLTASSLCSLGRRSSTSRSITCLHTLRNRLCRFQRHRRPRHCNRWYSQTGVTRSDSRTLEPA